MTSEAQLQHAVRLALGRHPDARLYRNEVGQARHEDPASGRIRVVRYGLCPGSSDLIGWRRVTITPEHVGSQIAQFVAIELKTATGRVATDQRQFIELVNRWGGVAGVARSVEDAQALISLPFPKP